MPVQIITDHVIYNSLYKYWPAERGQEPVRKFYISRYTYIGKKFVLLKEPYVFDKPVGPNNVKNGLFTMWFQDLANSL